MDCVCTPGGRNFDCKSFSVLRFLHEQTMSMLSVPWHLYKHTSAYLLFINIFYTHKYMSVTLYTVVRKYIVWVSIYILYCECIYIYMQLWCCHTLQMWLPDLPSCWQKTDDSSKKKTCRWSGPLAIVRWMNQETNEQKTSLEPEHRVLNLTTQCNFRLLSWDVRLK